MVAELGDRGGAVLGYGEVREVCTAFEAVPGQDGAGEAAPLRVDRQVVAGGVDVGDVGDDEAAVEGQRAERGSSR